MRKTIFVLGANPAWQKTLHFSDLRPGEVNRAARMSSYPAGKGVNFCRAAAGFGVAETLLFQFAGGMEGERLRAGLEREGIRHETVVTAAETRCCVTCLDRETGKMTELIEPSGRVSEEEADELLRRLAAKIPSASLFAIAGSLPDGADLSLYEKAASIAVAAGIPVLADAVKGIAPVLDLPGRIILKVNRGEFLALTGCDGLEEAHRCAAKRWPFAGFAVTAGPDRATFADRERGCIYTLPRLDRIVSPLGSGDTASAVLASGLLAGTDPAEAFRSALAAASANCLTERAGEFKREDWNSLLPRVRMEPFRFTVRNAS